MRITSKGQVTIPQPIRDRFGFFPETEVDFVVRGDKVHLVKATDEHREGRGARIVRRLRRSGTVRMTTDEIMALTRE